MPPPYPTVNVTLTILPAASPSIAVSPTSAQLVAPACPGGSTPASARLENAIPQLCIDTTADFDVSAADGAAHTITTTTSNPAVSPLQNQCSVSPSGHCKITISLDPTKVQGSATALVTFTPDSGPPITASLALVVTNKPILNAAPSSFAFNVQPGFTPESQALTLNTLGGLGAAMTYNLSFTSSSSNPCPITVTPASGSLTRGAATALIGVNPLAPATSSCSGFLTLTTTGTYNPAMTFPVTVSVKGALTNLVYSLDDLRPLNARLPIPNYGGYNDVLVSASDGSAIPFTVSAPDSVLVNNGQSEVTLTTPHVVILSASNSKPAPSFITFDNLKLSSAQAANSPVLIPISLTPKIAATVSTDPAALTLTAPPTGANTALPSTETVSFRAFGDPNVMYTVKAPSWLTVSPSTFTTPEGGAVELQATARLSDLAGNPAGVVSFFQNGLSNPSGNLPVNVGSSALLHYSESFPTAFRLRTTNVYVQSFQPLNNVSASVSTSSGLNFVTVNPNLFNLTPGVPTALSIQADLDKLTKPGEYTFSVNLKSSDGTLLDELPLSLDTIMQVSDPNYVPANIPLYFSSPPNATAPPPPSSIPSQTIFLPGTGQTFIARAPSFATVTPASGTTPQTLTVAANPAGLAPGSYVGDVTVTSAGNPSPITAPVNVVIGTAPAVAAVSAASGQLGPVSPGEIVSIFGQNIGPAAPVGLTLTSTGSLSTTLGSTQVFFDGIAAPLTYVGSGQINVIVPYEVGGKQFTKVVVQSMGVDTGETVLAVDSSAPGIFSQVGSGTGQGAILNQDFSPNSPSDPAPAGSVVTVYGTGEGPLMPSAATGSVTSSTAPSFPVPVSPVSITIGGQPAPIIYAGAAPGFASGVLQFNVTIPPGTSSGAQPIVLAIGNNDNAKQKITVAVK